MGISSTLYNFNFVANFGTDSNSFITDYEKEEKIKRIKTLTPYHRGFVNYKEVLSW